MEQKGQFSNKEKYQINLKLIILETILTSIGAGFSFATITVFWIFQWDILQIDLIEKL